MSKEEKDIGKIIEEMLNRPLELIEENKKLKKKIDKLQKVNTELEFKLLARERGEAEFEVLVDTLQKENEELEKTIDLMATELSRRPLMIYLDNERDDRLVILDNPKEIIKYYTKKAEEEK